MKTIEFLQKIGILGFGTAAGTCSSAKDAPDALMTDVYKPQKDHCSKEEADAEGQSA